MDVSLAGESASAKTSCYVTGVVRGDVEGSSDVVNLSQSDVTSYDELGLHKASDTARRSMIGAIGAGAMALVSVLMLIAWRGRSAGILLFVAMAAVIAVMLVFAFQFPSDMVQGSTGDLQIEESFIGQTSVGVPGAGIDIRWGPGSGYLCLAGAGVMLLVSALLSFKLKDPVEEEEVSFITVG